jgi:SAM-dependent MidA family methyltransferase
MRPAQPGSERIGWSGDFYTSSDVHPILGQALARQAQQLDSLLGHPAPFTVIEMGAGKGLLARDFLQAADQSADFRSRLRYVLVERSPAMRQLQAHHLRPWAARPGVVAWVEDLRSLPPASVVGLLFSNELPDAFPVHRIEMRDGDAREIFVRYADGRFIEELQPVTDAALAAHLAQLNLGLPDGSRAEVNLQALTWMEAVARAIDRGVAITIDYGHTTQDLYNADRSDGTLLCYYSQLTSENPYERVGEQDMTSHVDFSSLAAVGEAHGLHVTGYTNQLSFLMGLGVEDMIGRLEPESPEFRAAIHLLRPDGMGTTFKVLVQHKGIAKPRLDGLHYKPFFGEALALPAAGSGMR